MRIELYANAYPDREGPPRQGDLTLACTFTSEGLLGLSDHHLEDERGQRAALDEIFELMSGQSAPASFYAKAYRRWRTGDVVRFGPADWWACGEKGWAALEEWWPVPFCERVHLDAPPYTEATPVLEVHEALNGFYCVIYPVGLKGSSVCRGAGDCVGQYSRVVGDVEADWMPGEFGFYETMAHDFHDNWPTWLEAYFPDYMKGDPANAPRPAPYPDDALTRAAEAPVEDFYLDAETTVAPPSHVAGPFRWVIYGAGSVDDRTGARLFWNKVDGWQPYYSASKYTSEEMRKTPRPHSGVWCDLNRPGNEWEKAQARYRPVVEAHNAQAGGGVTVDLAPSRVYSAEFETAPDGPVVTVHHDSPFPLGRALAACAECLRSPHEGRVWLGTYARGRESWCFHHAEPDEARSVVGLIPSDELMRALNHINWNYGKGSIAGVYVDPDLRGGTVNRRMTSHEDMRRFAYNGVRIKFLGRNRKVAQLTKEAK
jgi:hypothetical protein